MSLLITVLHLVTHNCKVNINHGRYLLNSSLTILYATLSFDTLIFYFVKYIHYQLEMMGFNNVNS